MLSSEPSQERRLLSHSGFVFELDFFRLEYYRGLDSYLYYFVGSLQ